ncbi:hypothetical protein [Tengunoibacter tsumagoiensis]|nr:hypothetical protein [Tengunoibacter tsumagoiensis]
MEKKTENGAISTPVWVAPTLEVIAVSLECTAYANASEPQE